MKELMFTKNETNTMYACMRESFTGKQVYEVYNNPILQKEMDGYKDAGIDSWPAITINHKKYNGDLSPSIRVAEAICEQYTDKPDFCNEIDGKFHNIFDVRAETHYFAVFVIIIVLILVLLGMLYCYKRMMRREMTKEMNIQISQMVSQYFALNEGK